MDAQTVDTPVRPVPIPFAFENIPAELKAIPQWVTWKYLFRDKWTKPPFNAHSGELASSTNPATWADYETAVAAYRTGGLDGIGFVLTHETRIVGIDLDHCIDPQTKTFAPWALKIVDLFNCYVEVSPSGTGLRLFLIGELPAGGRKKGPIEVYPAGRFLTTTGRVLKASPVRTIEPRQAELDAFLAEHFPPEPKIDTKGRTASNGNGHLSDHEIHEIGLRAKNGDKLRSLLDGNCDGYPSPSEAELALCCLLAFYTQDETQIDRIYRGSRLFRDKWDDKHYGDGATYGEHTIQKAIAGTVESYKGTAGENGNPDVYREQVTHRGNEITDLSVTVPDDIPQSAPSRPTLNASALYGLAGYAVKTIEPYTEADPVAVLITFLISFGSVIGRTVHFKVEYTPHYLNLFASLVGESSKGRKGVSKSTVRYVFSRIDDEWTKDRNTSGLSSGEGLIYAVRDQTIQKQPVKEKGRVVDYQDVITDQGVSDKRLFVLEEELSQALKVMSREGNILSATVRQAWDSGDLHPLTKNNPIRATGAHISLLGHITKAELLRHLDETEKANGFANRFIWFLVQRSKVIPNPTGTPHEKLDPIVERLSEAIAFARKQGEMTRDAEAEAVYGPRFTLSCQRASLEW